MRRSASILLLASLAFASTAEAGKLDQAQRRLDAANLAAARHRAAAAAAARTEAADKRKQAALVAKEIAANAVLRADEDKSAAIVARLVDLQDKTKAAKAELDADAAAIAPLLPLITRLALHPAATLLAADQAPGEAAEGALVMRGITRQIGARAQALHAARQRYATLSTQLTDQKTQVAAAVATQQQADAALQADIAAVQRVTAASASRHAAEARAARLAANRAHDLLGVIAGLRREQEAAAKARAEQAAARVPAPALPKSLKGAPVAGSLVRGFATETAAGPATGDTFATAPSAMVSAACSGKVVFARPFETYGKLLILDCGGGYDFVMAGFDRFDVATGQHVAAGQPVGAMARYDPHNPGNQPRLYVELRRDGTAIDPAGHFGGASPAG